MTWLLIFLYVVFMIILCGNAEAADTVTAAGWYNPVALEWFCGIAACVVLGVSALVWATGTDKEPTYRIREVYGPYSAYGEEVHAWFVEKKGKLWGWNHIDTERWEDDALRVIREQVDKSENKSRTLNGPYYFTRKGEPHLKE